MTCQTSYVFVVQDQDARTAVSIAMSHLLMSCHVMSAGNETIQSTGKINKVAGQVRRAQYTTATADATAL